MTHNCEYNTTVTYATCELLCDEMCWTSICCHVGFTPYLEIVLRRWVYASLCRNSLFPKNKIELMNVLDKTENLEKRQNKPERV